MFDITTLAVADTAFIHLKSADGVHIHDADGKPVGVRVYGPSSRQFAALEAVQTARLLKLREANDGKPTAASPEQQRADQAEDLASITVAFENFAYSPAGEAQGAALFAAFYGDPKLGFMAVQVGKAVQNWGNFKPASPTS